MDRLLEALEIWRNESDELCEHREQCELAGKKVRERERERERENSGFMY